MNTRILYIALLLLTAVFPVKAQFGIGVGYTSSIHRVTVSGESETVPADGMSAGVSWETRLYKDFSFRTGLMYGFEWYNESYNYEISLEEYKYSIININERQTEHEITLPVQLGYELEIIPEILSFKAYAGPSLYLGLSSSSEISMFGAIDMAFKQNNFKGDSEYSYFPYDEEYRPLMTEAITDASMLYKRADLSLGGSIGLVIIKQIGLELGYDFGMMNRFRPQQDGTYRKDRYYFRLNYMF